MRSRFGLDQDLELHDAYHVEVKRDYPVSWNGQPGSYVVEAYVFLPYSFGIAPDTFPADQLFGLTQSYLRWRDDDFTYEEFADPASTRSPLARLERGIVAALERPGPTLDLAHEARVAGCAIRVFLKGGAARLVEHVRALEARSRRSPAEPGAAEAVREEVTRYLDRACALLERMRKARFLAQQGSEVLHPDLVRGTRLVDEYLSTIFDQVLAQMFSALDGARIIQDGRGGRASLVARIKEAARREAVYRSRAGFISLDVESPQQRELYSFRLSLLKKWVSKPLYLEVTTRRPRPTYLQHAVGAIAAALAAAWALFAQIYLLQPQDPSGTVTTVTNILFAAAVLAYVLKDRMKAFVNETVMRRLSSGLPARDVLLSEAPNGDGHHGGGREIGRIQEQACFVAPGKVPPEVLVVRNLGHTVDLGEERLEVILHHSRKVDLEPAFAHSPHRAVRDILRLNVAPFLERLADPDLEVQHFDGRTDSFVRRTAPRVYHLNLVFRLAPLDGKSFPVRYERIRVVLSQRGINRVEEAVPLGTLEEARSRRGADARVAGGIFD